MTNPPIDTSGLNGAGAPIPLGDVASRAVAVTDLPQFEHLRRAAERTGPRKHIALQPTPEQLDQTEAFSTHRVAAEAAARVGPRRVISSLEAATNAARRAAAAAPEPEAPDTDRLDRIEAAVEQLAEAVAALRAELLETRAIADGAAGGAM